MGSSPIAVTYTALNSGSSFQYGIPVATALVKLFKYIGADEV